MLLRHLHLLFVLLGFVIVPIAAAEETIIIEVAPFFGGSFKAGQWLPLQVTVTNNGPDHDATVRIGGASGASFDAAVELPRGARKTFLMYARPDGFARSIKARVLDGEQELAQAEIPVSAWSSGTEVIGLLTARSITVPPPVSRSPQIKVTTHPITIGDLPARAEGLSSFAILVVDGIALDSLAPEQTTALADWIRSGGQLVIGASEGQRTIDALPVEMRIASAGEVGAQEVAGTLLAGLGPEARIDAAALTPIEGAVAVDALAAQKDAGRGRVTLLGFSLSDPALQELAADVEMWPQILRLREFDPNFPPDVTADEMQAQQLTQALFNLPVLALPPLNVLAGLLVAYMVLVGPVLYLLLWRLDRQAWAWIAIPALTLVFSAGTYSYGLRIRGNDVILNQISIAQPMGDRARVRTYAGLFSPTARNYDIAVDDEALTRPLLFDPRSWGREVGAASARGHYMQGSSGIRDLPVAQWAMSTFAAEGTVDIGALTAQMELGEGILRGTVHNGGTALLRDVALIHGNRAEPIGDLASGAEKSVEIDLTTQANQGGAPLSMMLFRDRWDPNKAPPAELRLPIQVVDSLYGYSPAARQAEPLLIGWLDESPIGVHIADGRIQHQQLTLVEIPIEISYGSSVNFPRGWLRPRLQSAGPEEGMCMTQWGPGSVLMNSDMLTATLRLPATAQSFQVDKATLFAEIDGPAAERVLLEAFDWQAAAWTQQAEKLGAVELSDPGRFIENGEMRFRLTIPQGMARGGCVHLGATVGGTR